MRDLGEVLFYGLDSSLPVRVNPDNVVNDYGNKLLTLCKSSGLRILNGRHSLGMDKDFTFVGPRGMSVVDYLISSPDVFKLIDQFIVSNFNMFSDHAPLHIRLKSGNYLNSTSGGAFCENQMTRQFIWNQDLQSQAREVLLEHSEELMSYIQKNPSESQSSIDESIDMFTSRLTDLMRPCFEISKVTPKVGQVSKIPRVHSGVNSMDKPWFNEKLKRKYRIYRSALCHFNSYKNKENQLKLMEAKKIYKKSEAKLKRQYLRKEGDLIEHLRKHNPKEFYKHFHRRKNKNNSIDLESFQQHFQELATFSNNTSIETPVDTGHTVFDELEMEITIKEISAGIDHLKRKKSHGLDYVLNEYFIEFKDIFLPQLCIIFNRILTSGFFPTQWSDAVIIPVFKKGDPDDPNNYIVA